MPKIKNKLGGNWIRINIDMKNKLFAHQMKQDYNFNSIEEVYAEIFNAGRIALENKHKKTKVRNIVRSVVDETDSD